MLIAGVDDAGRGSIIGPLVIAGILLDENELPKLKDLGVKDSKRLSPCRREQLAVEIKKLPSKYCVMKLRPAEIDTVVEKGRRLHKLNRLEARTMAKVIAVLHPEVAYVDPSDVLADRFKSHIMETVPFKVQIISEHKADSKYPIVSAASILAKVERDLEISKLKERHGEVGCGYPTDAKTLEFLENLIRKHGSYPDYVRKSWKPAKRIKRKAIRKKLV